MKTSDIAVGQIWKPTGRHRAKAREVISFKTDPDGYPAVVYSPFQMDCGHTGTSTIRLEGFREWIRRMQAVRWTKFEP